MITKTRVLGGLRYDFELEPDEGGISYKIRRFTDKTVLGTGWGPDNEQEVMAAAMTHLRLVAKKTIKVVFEVEADATVQQIAEEAARIVGEHQWEEIHAG
jgi:hypothetical protein